jgi:3-isopropylmalate/(R)-2-methylmalate dehydratase small subunit
LLIKGRVWKFGDNIDTDLMMPQDTFRLPIEERAKAVFRANRPGWVKKVKRGDVLVAGKNFGVGSSRPAARSLKFLGIEAIIAESVNSLFFRNCINYGLLALNLPCALNYFQEGDLVEIDPHGGTIKNMNTGSSFNAEPFPEMLIRIVEAGGMIELLQKEGYLASEAYEKEQGR